jgi:hypothetical protein
MVPLFYVYAKVLSLLSSPTLGQCADSSTLQLRTVMYQYVPAQCVQGDHGCALPTIERPAQHLAGELWRQVDDAQQLCANLMHHAQGPAQKGLGRGMSWNSIAVRFQMVGC